MMFLRIVVGISVKTFDIKLTFSQIETNLLVPKFFSWIMFLFPAHSQIFDKMLQGQGQTVQETVGPGFNPPPGVDFISCPPATGNEQDDVSTIHVCSSGSIRVMERLLIVSIRRWLFRGCRHVPANC